MPKHGGNQGGRPTVFTRELVEEIFAYMRDEGLSPPKAVEKAGLAWGTWSRWLYVDKYNPTPEDDWFRLTFAHTRKALLDNWFWGTRDIAADSSRDLQPYERFSAKTGELIEKGVKSDNTSVNRDKLRVDTTLRIAAAMSADYSSISKHELSGKNGGPLLAVIQEKE